MTAPTCRLHEHRPSADCPRCDYVRMWHADELPPEDVAFADRLRSLPTIAQAQADDLKLDTGSLRVWLSRCGIADGEPFEETVTVETRRHDARGWDWVELCRLDGDNTSADAAELERSLGQYLRAELAADLATIIADTIALAELIESGDPAIELVDEHRDNHAHCGWACDA